MLFAPLVAFFALIPAAVYSSPIPANEAGVETFVPRSLGKFGSYVVPGLGERKKQLLSCGANALDLAIAMLESDHMATDYIYGDGKSGAAANFGIFKQNWDMLLRSTARYRAKHAKDFNIGSELNRNVCLDIKMRHESQKHFGEGMWFAGHRNGASGLANPVTQDIQNYKDAVYWIRNQLKYHNNGAGMMSDVRYWVDVVAI